MFFLNHVWNFLRSLQGGRFKNCWSLVLFFFSLFLLCHPAGLPVSTYAKFCHRKLQKVAITGGKKVSGKNINRIACRFHTIKERRICCDSTFDSWRYHCSETGNYRPSNSGSQRHKEPPSSPHSCRGGIMFSDIPRSKSSFTSHPSRVYASPPWRRSTTVGGLLSHPPCLAALWRR